MANVSRKDFTRQFDHVAVVAHGAHPEYRLEFDAYVADEDASKGIYQGSIVSLNADGKFVIGCPVGTGVNFPVPMISMKNVADPDVSAGTLGKDYRTSTYSAIGGKITAIPCTGSYEIETTEFDSTVQYAPNDGLVADTAKLGQIKKATAQPGTTEVYIGFVSQAAYYAKNYNHNRLSFFANFIPCAHA